MPQVRGCTDSEPCVDSCRYLRLLDRPSEVGECAVPGTHLEQVQAIAEDTISFWRTAGMTPAVVTVQYLVVLERSIGLTLTDDPPPDGVA